MKKPFYKLMFLFYVIVFILFIVKLDTKRLPELNIPTEAEIDMRNYDEPSVFLEDSTIPEYKKAYYDRLYDY